MIFRFGDHKLPRNASKRSVVTSFETNLFSINALNTPLLLLNFYTFGVPPPLRYSGLVITCYTPNASKHSVVTSFKTNLLSIHTLNTPLVLLTFYIFGVSQRSVVTSIETNLLRITALKPYYLTSLPSTVKLCFETSVILKVQ